MELIVFDLETTGVDRKNDQIIQFSALKIDTTENKILKTYDTYVQPIGAYSISIGAYYKHKITPEFLSDKPYLHEIAQDIVDFFKGCDNILTYNGNGFDIPFLKTELNKYGYDIDFVSKNCYDAFLEERRRNGISLENTYKRYAGRTMEEAGLVAHNALSDIKGTYSVFVAQQRIESYGPEHMYGEDGVIQDMLFNDETQPCFAIGKYRGVSVKLVSTFDQSYLNWCVGPKSNFLESTKEYIRKYIK